MPPAGSTQGKYLVTQSSLSHTTSRFHVSILRHNHKMAAVQNQQPQDCLGAILEGKNGIHLDRSMQHVLLNTQDTEHYALPTHLIKSVCQFCYITRLTHLVSDSSSH